MKFNKISRRHFLQGIGGSSLALPFMSSLWSRDVHAQTNFNAPKFLAVMASPHGCLDNESWLPGATPANEIQLYSGDAAQGMDHKIRYDNLTNLLTARTDEFNPAGIPELSPTLGSFLNPYLPYINLYAGLDIMFYIAHHRGGHLGNFHGNDGNGDVSLLLPAMPTIDQVIAQSANFYGENDPFVLRTLNIADHYPSISYSAQNNAVQYTNTVPNNAANFYDEVFGDNSQGEPDERGVKLRGIINKVYEDYSRLANGTFGPGKRLSYQDRQRLQEHMTELDELERRISNLYLTCEAVQRPSSQHRFYYEDHELDRVQVTWDVFFDVVMAAFRCGKSRIATMALGGYTEYLGDWHQDIAHQHFNNGPQAQLITSHRYIAEHCFTRLVSKMATNMGLGNDDTYLDHGLVVWNHESSYEAHKSYSHPTISAGNAGGFFNTGLYVDYRNMSNLGLSGGDASAPDRAGIPYNRWLYTVLKAMNIPDAEFARAGMVGYGDPLRDHYFVRQHHEPWPDRVMLDCNTPLPIVTTS